MLIDHLKKGSSGTELPTVLGLIFVWRSIFSNDVRGQVSFYWIGIDTYSSRLPLFYKLHNFLGIRPWTGCYTCCTHFMNCTNFTKFTGNLPIFHSGPKCCTDIWTCEMTFQTLEPCRKHAESPILFNIFPKVSPRVSLGIMTWRMIWNSCWATVRGRHPAPFLQAILCYAA